MEQYIFIREEFELFKQGLQDAEAELSNIDKSAADAAAGSDGWHSETYKLSRVQERVQVRRVEELREIRRKARVIDRLEEQNEVVKIGNGVVIRINGGRAEKYYLGGFRIESVKGHISVQSPLGKCLILGRRGEVKQFVVDGVPKSVEILDIVLPSKAKEFAQL